MLNKKESKNLVHRYPGILALAILLLAAALSLGCVQSSDDFHKTIPVTDSAELTVANRNGNIEITVWDEDYIDIYAVKRSTFGSGELEKVQIRVEENDVIKIESEYLTLNAQVSVNYEIRVPSHVTVSRVESSNGSIKLAQLTGDTVVETSNGSVDIHGVDGSVYAKSSNGKINITGTTTVLGARTSNGGVIVEISRIDQDVEIKTSNGSVKVYISPDLDADLHMDTSNGKINLHGVEVIASAIGDKLVRGKLGDGGHRLSVSTSNGSIDLYPLE